MRFVALVTMLLACLVYGFMPARASQLADISAAAQATVSAHSGHHGMTMQKDKAVSDPCPHHGGGMPHSAFCAACLAVLPLPVVARDSRSPYSWPAPLPHRQLMAGIPAPAEPPPRI